VVPDHQGGHSRVRAESHPAGGDLPLAGALHQDLDFVAGIGQPVRPGARPRGEALLRSVVQAVRYTTLMQ